RPVETVRSQLKRGLGRLQARIGTNREERRESLIGLAWLRRLTGRRARGESTFSASHAFVLAAVLMTLVVWTFWSPEKERGPALLATAKPVDSDETSLPALEQTRALALEREAIPLPATTSTELGLQRLAGYVRRPDGTPAPGAQVHAGRPGASAATEQSVF